MCSHSHNLFFIHLSPTVFFTNRTAQENRLHRSPLEKQSSPLHDTGEGGRTFSVRLSKFYRLCCRNLKLSAHFRIIEIGSYKPAAHLFQRIDLLSPIGSARLSGSVPPPIERKKPPIIGGFSVYLLSDKGGC